MCGYMRGLLESLHDLSNVVFHQIHISASRTALRERLEMQVCDDLHTRLCGDLSGKIRVIGRIQKDRRRLMGPDLLDQVCHLLGGWRGIRANTGNDRTYHNKTIAICEITEGLMIGDEHAALWFDLVHLIVDPGIQLGELIYIRLR